MPTTSHAATTYQAARASIDSIVGQSGANAPAPGYYPGASTNSTRVGGTGSSTGGTRVGQDLVYRYTLPTLNPGESIESFQLTFQITAFRDHAGDDPRLDVYLLDVADPTVSGTSFFYRGVNDPNPTTLFVGGHFEDAGPNTGSIDLAPDVDVLFTVNSGPTLALLQGFYGGDHLPDQAEASFRFNLTSGDALVGTGLNRYFINDDVATSGLQINAIPEPSGVLLACLGVLGLLRRRQR